MRLAQIGWVGDVLRQHLDAKLKELGHRGGGFAGVVGVGQLEQAVHEGLHTHCALGFVEGLLLAPGRIRNSGHECDRYKQCSCDRRAVAADEFAEAINRSLGTRQHRPAIEVSVYIHG